MCYDSGATSEYQLKICVFAPTGSVRPPPTILLVRKLGCMIFHAV